MTVLLIITTVGVILLGYLVMCRLDNFFERGGILDSPQGRANQGVLIYGAPDVAERIQKIGMKSKNLTTLSFPEDGFYSALFAISDNDQDNLAICYAAKQADPGIAIIARYNTAKVRSTFEAIGADSLLNVNEPVDTLLAELWGVGK